MKEGICLLCLSNRSLIKAHIYPEWSFKFLYRGGIVDNNAPLLSISGDRKYSKKRPIGIWDPNILCFDCDSLIGKQYDDPAKEAVLESDLHLFKEMQEGKVWILQNIKPSVLKNFFISTIFRSAISNTEEFSKFTLPEKFLNRMREIILKNELTTWDEYQVFIQKSAARHPILKEAAQRFITPPYRIKVEGINYIVQNLPRYKVYLKVDQRSVGDELSAFSLRPDYPIYVLEWENFEDSTEFKMFAHLVEQRKRTTGLEDKSNKI